jgi:prevent-host-death family protein
MTTMTASDAREHLSDLLEKARHTGERTLITRRGRKLAAVVSVEDLELLEELEDRVDLAAVRESLKERNKAVPYQEFRTTLELGRK